MEGFPSWANEDANIEAIKQAIIFDVDTMILFEFN